MPEFSRPVSDEFRNEGAAPDGMAAITLEHDPEGVTVRTVGELDVSTVPKLARVLDQLNGGEPDRVLLDLDGVEFMDSGGMAALIHAQEAADLNSYRLAVRHSSPQIHRLLELTGMLDHFHRDRGLG
jgi:anti-sigma B factor antagonist